MTGAVQLFGRGLTLLGQAAEQVGRDELIVEALISRAKTANGRRLTFFGKHLIDELLRADVSEGQIAAALRVSRATVKRRANGGQQ